MEHLFDAFKIRAEAVSAEVHRFATKAEGLAFITSFLRDAGVSTEPNCGAVWAADSFLDANGPQRLSEQVPGLTFEVTTEAAAAARVGISQLDWAIAGTGTLVQDATAVAKRLVSTLPPIHVAVVGTGRILESLGGVLQRLRPDQVNCISFITGPSRTADIERVLTIGVHGPERLIIVFVDDFAQVAA
jgi:L-lactate dehydrogenase complex protein LldG